MKKLSPNRKWLLWIAVAAISSGITAGVFSAKRNTSNRQQKRVTELPEVKSNVPRLGVAGVTVKNSGTPAAIAVVEIRNNSPLAVVAVEISTKNDSGDSAAVTTDGLANPENPRTVIPPWSTTTLEMSFGEMVADAPLIISGAVFADGTEEGDKWSLDAMRKFRGKHREQIKERERSGQR